MSLFFLFVIPEGDLLLSLSLLLLLSLPLFLLLSLSLFVLPPPTQKTCHFDRSCSQPHREQRSGETRFSTHTASSRCLFCHVILTLSGAEGEESLYFARSAPNRLRTAHNPTPEKPVKPQPHLANCNKSTYPWHTNYQQPSIIDTETRKSPGKCRGSSPLPNNLQLTTCNLQLTTCN